MGCMPYTNIEAYERDEEERLLKDVTPDKPKEAVRIFWTIKPIRPEDNGISLTKWFTVIILYLLLTTLL